MCASAHEREERGDEHREQVARQNAAEPPAVKRAGVQPSGGAHKRLVEQKPREQQREVYKHIPAPDNALEIEIMSAERERGVEPRLLPDVEPRHGEYTENAQHVRRREIPASRRGAQRERISHLNSVPFTVILP